MTQLQREVLMQAAGDLPAIDRALSHVPQGERGWMIEAVIRNACATIAGDSAYGMDALAVIVGWALVGPSEELRRGGIGAVATAHSDLCESVVDVVMQSPDVARKVDCLQALRKVRPELAQEWAARLASRDVDDEVREVAVDILEKPPCAGITVGTFDHITIAGVGDGLARKALVALAAPCNGADLGDWLEVLRARSPVLHVFALAALSMQCSDAALAERAVAALSMSRHELAEILATAR